MEALAAITYADRENYHLRRLLASAAHWGIGVTVLGLGKPWQGFLQKLRALRAFLSRLPQERLCLCTDGYDVIYLQPAAVIVERYRRFDAPVVFAAERCFHAPGDEALQERYPASPTPYRYLNAGAFIGPAGVLVPLLDQVLAAPRSEVDQALFSRHYLDHPGSIVLDHRAELFVTTSNRQYDEDLAVCDHRLYHRLTGTWPCLLHTPGGYYGVLEYYSRQLPFSRALSWSGLDFQAGRQILGGLLNLHAYRRLKRRGWVKDQDDFSGLLARTFRRGSR
jgi:hypothetical protein